MRTSTPSHTPPPQPNTGPAPPQPPNSTNDSAADLLMCKPSLPELGLHLSPWDVPGSSVIGGPETRGAAEVALAGIGTCLQSCGRARSLQGRHTRQDQAQEAPVRPSRMLAVCISPGVSLPRLRPRPRQGPGFHERTGARRPAQSRGVQLPSGRCRVSSGKTPARPPRRSPVPSR